MWPVLDAVSHYKNINFHPYCTIGPCISLFLESVSWTLVFFKSRKCKITIQLDLRIYVFAAHDSHVEESVTVMHVGGAG